MTDEATYWNTLLLTLGETDGHITPTYGTGGWNREEARAEVQRLLDRLAGDRPDVGLAAAELWRAGTVKDDTVHIAPTPGSMLLFAVYEYPRGEDPVHQAMAWMDDFSLRATGQPSQMIVPPTAPGGTFGAAR
ncbi:hypothetical protein AB0E08_08250 [Streptomyces sp. NPDC048281]|uniref:hypothetical protein n=1 Tax=Streptomyces sp. NPDC048281 TaxID=3154715 RepID=UPI003442B139